VGRFETLSTGVGEKTFVAKLVDGTAGTVGRLYCGFAGIVFTDSGCNRFWLA
jgi:hypothetical protein